MTELILERSSEPSYMSTIAGLLDMSSDSGRIATAVGRAVSNSLGTAISSGQRLRTNIPIDEQLFDARANFKVTASKYAMHLGKDWRDRLFSQIDTLLDAAEWQDADAPITNESARTFLRMLVYLQARRPGLGAAHDGSLIASWTAGANQLTILCQPNDRVRWMISADMPEGRETAAGSSSLHRLPEILMPYNPKQWFGDGGRQNP